MKRPEETSLYTGHWVDGDGPLDALLLLVGQAPGRTEVLRGRPFVGAAGQMLQACVAEAGLEWAQVRRTNVVRCRPTDARGENRAPTREEIKEYVPWLWDEIDAMPNLRVIVALGNEAMIALTGRSGISAKRGEEVTIQRPSGRTLTVLPTFHPSYVLRRRSARPLLVTDLSRARRIARDEPFADPAERVVFVRSAALPDSLHGMLTIDVETDADDRPRLFAVGASHQRVYVLPVDERTRELPLWRRPATWIGHNLRADQRWLRMVGVDLGWGLEDTMLMAHLLDENRPVGLKKLALQHLDPSLYWQYIEPLLRRPDTRGAIDFRELGTYCANDVAATWLLYDELFRQLRREPRLDLIYRRISLPLSAALLEAECRGIMLDINRADELRGRLAAERAEVERELAARAGRSINWASPEQVARLLYEDLRLPVPHRTKAAERGSTDEKALRRLVGQHPLVGALIRWRRVNKQELIVRTMLTRVRADGRIYPTFNQCGTVTGRLSQHDPNLQNIPTDSAVRSLIVAPPGHVILAADFAMIELVVAAWLFGEQTILDAYTAGRDLHTETATALLGRPPATAEERKKYGKTPNFALLYQQGDAGFVEYAAKQGVELTLEQARAMRTAWHALYPGIRRGWQRYALDLEACGYVESPIGWRRRLPEFHSGSTALRNEAWRQGCNFPVQNMAVVLTHVGAIIAQSILRAAHGAHLIHHIHDQLVFEVPIGQAREAAATLAGILTVDVPAFLDRVFGVRLPFTPRVEVGLGRSLGELTRA
jgi:uracil-DNA glycosylase family 4